MINFIIETEENDNNNKEYCSCEVTEQLQISEDINNMTDKKNGREYLGCAGKIKRTYHRDQPLSGGRPERD